jgi:UDP-N-acetylmuramate--alanine ligase
MVERGRLIAVFQSHTYSRTAAFLEEICSALRLADRVLVAPIYAAREQETLGMSAALLAEGVGTCATAHESREQIAAVLEDEAEPGDLIVVMGAGDIDGIFRVFSRKHFTIL